MSTLSAKIRASDARSEISRLRTDVQAWLAHRRKLDTLQQFTTQLGALEGVLLKALTGVEAPLTAASNAPLGIGLDECRRVERGAVWVRRVWSFFRWRFDQRDTPGLRQVLAAADEVVWSCYATAFRQAGLAVPSAPLAYIEERFSPFAVPRQDLPPDLQYDVDASFLKDFLSSLPIPVLGLPPATAEFPWSLVLVGHEAGHHVQYDLVPAAALVDTFTSALTETIETAHGAAVANRWAPWSREIFADAWSVLTLGPAALWGLIDLEAASDARLLRARAAYPSPLVRFAVMADYLKCLGTPSVEALRGLDPQSKTIAPATVVDGIDLTSAYVGDLSVIPTVTALLVSTTIAHGLTLPELGAYDASQFMSEGAVEEWQTAYAAADPPQPVETLESARLATSGAVWAWAALHNEPSAQREQQRISLRDRVLNVIPHSREASVRASAPAPQFDAEDSAERLRALVLDHAPDPAPLSQS